MHAVLFFSVISTPNRMFWFILLYIIGNGEELSLSLDCTDKNNDGISINCSYAFTLSILAVYRIELFD